MAWSSADLSADELAFFAADKPILAGSNALESPQAAEWRTSGSFASGSDATDADGPTRRAYDRHTFGQTFPDSSQATWYLMFQTAASPLDFDGVLLLNHNLGTIGGVAVTVEIADDNAFTSNLKSISLLSPGTSNKRIADLDLNHSGSGSANAQRYSGVAYVRIKFFKSGGHIPKIGEVLFTRRRQLKHDPEGDNFDPKALQSQIARFESESGVVSAYVRNRGRRLLSATVGPYNATQIDDIDQWFSETAHGTKPFVWIPEPSSAPSDFCLMHLNEAALAFPYAGPTRREITIEAAEQGPHYLELE